MHLVQWGKLRNSVCTLFGTFCTMERPGSHGNRALAFGGVSKAPTGNPIAPPPRPSTPMRGSGAAQAVGGFSQCAQRIGTGLGRVGTPLKPGTPFNPGLHSAFDRPVTQQGMTGIQGSVQGLGRQIQDKTFYMNLLRAKKQDIMVVNEEMRVGPCMLPLQWNTGASPEVLHWKIKQN